MCQMNNRENNSRNNTNRDYLLPYLNQKVVCTGRFITAKYMRDETKKGVSLLFRNIMVNDEVPCDHAWFVYLRRTFGDVVFGINDILRIECSVVEYVDKNGNKKIGFDEITKVENLSNHNQLFENIPFKVIHTRYTKKYLMEHGGKLEEFKPIQDLEDACGVSTSKHYTLNLTGLTYRENHNSLAHWYGIEDDSHHQLVKNAVAHPYRYEHGLMVCDNFFCKINEEAYRQISTNHFILTCLVANLDKEKRDEFMKTQKEKIKEKRKDRKSLEKNNSAAFLETFFAKDNWFENNEEIKEDELKYA